MAEIQKYFEQFHEKIRIDFEMSDVLREKRDIILDKIRSYLRESDLPSFKELHQGSYAMKTGVKPLDGEEYDIDVGLRFSMSEDDYLAGDVRQWVLDAVEGHTHKVDNMPSCVRVAYAEDYHVDLVCYAVWEDDAGNTEFRLAHRDKGWRPAEPTRLLDLVKEAMQPFEEIEDSATATNQFRRVVRYIRRWIDENFEPSARPAGIGIVVLASDHLEPTTKWDGTADDATALRSFANELGTHPGRLVAQKPTPEYEDLLAAFSDSEMEGFKEGLRELSKVIASAQNEIDPVDACKALARILGSDFPVPKAEDTAKKTRGPAIVPSSSSG